MTDEHAKLYTCSNVVRRLYQEHPAPCGALASYYGTFTGAPDRQIMLCSNCAVDIFSHGVRAVQSLVRIHPVDGLPSSMTPNQYQTAVMRTAPTEYRTLTTEQMHMVHAILGLATELGELATPIKKHIIYGAPLDVDNIDEEHGDMFWYHGLLASALGNRLSATLANNVRKLMRRYPKGYSDKDALARADKAENS